MPYLEYLFCERCGDISRLIIDPGATIDAYNEEGRKSTFINQATLIWDYLIYTCSFCGQNYKYTYRDVERRVREYLSSRSEEFRQYIDGIIDGDSSKGIACAPPRRIKEVYTRK